jgi:hypothetical protein
MGGMTAPLGGMASYTGEAEILSYSINQWTGESISGTAGTTILAGQLCYLNTAGQWRVADADSLAESTPLLGICLLTATSSGPTFMLLKGFIRTNYSLGSAPGEPLYIEPGTGGSGVGYMNPVAPTAPGQIVRLVGHTYSSDKIRFNPDNIWIEL